MIRRRRLTNLTGDFSHAVMKLQACVKHVADRFDAVCTADHQDYFRELPAVVQNLRNDKRNGKGQSRHEQTKT